jgi:hypothetical protein
MKKKPKIGDTVHYTTSNNGVGTGIILDPVIFGVKKNDRLYYERENYVLIQAIIDNKPSYAFWKRYKELIEKKEK